MTSDTDIQAFLESLGPNEGFAAELYRAYQSNRLAVPERWRAVFDEFHHRLAGANGRGEGEGNGHFPHRAELADGAAAEAAESARAWPAADWPTAGPKAELEPAPGPSPTPSLAVAAIAAVPPPQSVAVPASPDSGLQPLRGGALRLATNMAASLGVPTATSQRSIPVRLLEENRHLLNRHLAARGQKLSLTPLLAWALTRALEAMPALNAAYGELEGAPARLTPEHINLGLAVDVESRDGGRGLMVPVLKAAETLDFGAFFAACDRLIRAARGGRLAPEELRGATLSLTNPGTLGTRASVPRLMPGQGAIIAAGAVAYPPGFEAVPEATLLALGVGKVLTLACTYDHRVIHGAESGAFLARVEALLLGEEGFYDRIFHDLGLAFQPARWAPNAAPADAAAPEAAVRRGEDAEIRKQTAVFQLVHAYRVRGHLQANVDPLEFRPMAHRELDIAYHGLSLWDLDRRFLSQIAGGEGSGSKSERMLPLRDILEVLRATYCGTLACEFMHLQALEQRQWLTAAMEPSRNQWPLSRSQRLRILRKLTDAENFERLLHTRYVGHKRFSLEGAESLIPALDRLCALAADAGMGEALIGMAHRGRLNVLTNIVGQPMNSIFSKFEDADPDSVEGSGDVKYHIGAAGVYLGPEDERLEISVSPNPSHLEAVDPVLEGAARARQEALLDTPLGRRVLPILIHGDAAFAGQGIVAETLNLSQLEGYRTGGTIHIVVNNRIGFTTAPSDARSTLYSTDVARMVQAPIWHVNGDDPEAVVRAMELAFRFRQEFHKDVVLDLVCYRRHGHNEGDDPSLTQPVLYRNIDHHPSVRALYAERLVAAEVLAAAAAGEMAEESRRHLAESPADAAAEGHENEHHENGHAREAETREAEPEEEGAQPAAAPSPEEAAKAAAELVEVGADLERLPEGFTVHPKLKAFLERRAQAVANRGPVDWSLAEALAFGTLLREGIPIRLTGQDTGRGTFSQRHAVLYDYQTGAPYAPLAHLREARAGFALHDSLLSEAAALGFEFGYALRSPRSLVLWEAQFGDFANGAQVIIDQFLAASAAKWGLPSGLVLLLPHGYEGQGPEHSSARMERFLQLCAAGNLRVANCTTAAQYFHLLRRHARTEASAPQGRRPLVIFTPKSLLRHPAVASPFAALAEGHFHPVLEDGAAGEPASAEAERIVFCSGKIYYDLLKRRGELERGGAAAGARTSARAGARSGERPVALARVERLYPFPAAELRAVLAHSPRAQSFVWAQEEPANMGAWTFIQPRLAALLAERSPDAKLIYAGRAAAASPATGSLRRHQKEQAQILADALEL